MCWRFDLASVPSQTTRSYRSHHWQRECAGQREPVDSLCLAQACRGVLVDLHCAVGQWAEHYKVPTEALRAMISDVFTFERYGCPPLSFEWFVAYANEITAQESSEEVELTQIVLTETLEPSRVPARRDESLKRPNESTHQSCFEVLPVPSFGEWLGNSLAGRPPGETPQLIGAETLFEKIKFCRSNVVNLEERLSEEITSANYEEAQQTCEELRWTLESMAAISEDVQDFDSEEYSNLDIAGGPVITLPGVQSEESVEPDCSL
jgi:hypothetical protein